MGDLGHKLIINSLEDGQATCSCGNWHYSITGELDRMNVYRQWTSHIPDTDEFPVEPLSNGYYSIYKRLASGTCFHYNTPDEVMNVLEDVRIREKRIKIVLGNTENGASWHERHDVAGFVGRSTGRIRVPLLIHNRRSRFGPAILDHCIIGIRYANRKNGGWLYRHPKYTEDE